MELDETTMMLIGITAGILVLSGWIPQIVKGYRTKRMNDVSVYLMIIYFAGAFLRFVYGLALDDIYIIGTNLIIALLTMLVLFMKLKYGRIQANQDL